MTERSGPRRGQPPAGRGVAEAGALGSAPRADLAEAAGLPSGARGPQALVDQLIANFSEQVRRALKFDLDGSETSLAFVDHYLRLAQDEDREPIVTLLAAGAGAYFGDLVRRDLGAIWIGDAKDPRRLRLLMTAQFIHFSPVDQAFEAIAGRALGADDPRLPSVAPAFDPGFHLAPPRNEGDDGPAADDDDGTWLEARLAELPPVPEDEFHSLTCRFETLKLMLELLAAKHADEGRTPAQYGAKDYLAALTSPD